MRLVVALGSHTDLSWIEKPDRETGISLSTSRGTCRPPFFSSSFPAVTCSMITGTRFPNWSRAMINLSAQETKCSSSVGQMFSLLLADGGLGPSCNSGRRGLLKWTVKHIHSSSCYRPTNTHIDTKEILILANRFYAEHTRLGE